MFPAENIFYIFVLGVKNPSIGTDSIGWSIRSLYDGFLINQNQNFISFKYTTPFSPGTIIFSSILANPTNAESNSDYTIVFTPKSEIPAGGSIIVDFDKKDYPNLPTIPDCKLTGGLTTFASCASSGNILTIITD